MLTGIIMPSGGQNTDESLLVKWHKNIGDRVGRGEVLFEIETDKANMEVESYADGILLSKNFNEGDSVGSGKIVAYIGDTKDAVPENTGIQQKIPENIIEKAAAKEPMTKVSSGPFDIASPAARKMLKDGEIGIARVLEYTSNRPLKKADIESYIKSKTIKQGSESAVLLYSISAEIDITDTLSVMNRINEYLGGDDIKVSIDDILMKCASKAAEDHPDVNGSDGDVDFRFAKEADGQLIYPVIRKTNRKNLYEIASESARAEIGDGTITLIDLGRYGADAFTAVPEHNERCVLAAGRIRQVLPRYVMTVSATFNRNRINYIYGARFMDELKALLEDIRRLLI